MKKKLSPCFKKNERGVALIEFTIIAPILILLVLGIVEFGWMFNGWITITGAAREGARIASVLRVFEDNYVPPENGESGSWDDYIIEAVKNHATPTFSESNVSVSTNRGYDAPEDGEYIVIEVEGILNPLVGFFIRNPQTLYGEATMRTE